MKKLSLILVLPLFLLILQSTVTTNAKEAEKAKGSDTLNLLKNAEKNMRGYKKDKWPEGWKMEDGVLHGSGKGGDIMTKEEYGDFELNLEWKISKGGNSGIIFRSSKGDSQAYISGPEIQVFDDQGKEPNLHSAGAFYDLYVPSKKMTKPAGEWNKARLRIVGNHVTSWLNGEKIIDVEMWSDDWNEHFNKSKFKTWKKFGRNKKGHLVLQEHGSEVWYRNMTIKKITAEK